MARAFGTNEFVRTVANPDAFRDISQSKYCWVSSHDIVEMDTFHVARFPKSVRS